MIKQTYTLTIEVQEQDVDLFNQVPAIIYDRFSGTAAKVLECKPANEISHDDRIICCVYCNSTNDDLILSELVPDGTVYPGVQRMCRDSKGCEKRIHHQYHQDVKAPECEHCNQNANEIPAER